VISASLRCSIPVDSPRGKVEDRVLEIVGFNSEFGLEMGEFSEPCERV
jgi:hypothetical protein